MTQHAPLRGIPGSGSVLSPQRRMAHALYAAAGLFLAPSMVSRPGRAWYGGYTLSLEVSPGERLVLLTLQPRECCTVVCPD